MSYKLTKELKEKWITALESGEYEQGSGQLKSTNGADSDTGCKHCCLGVLAEVMELKIDANTDGILIDSKYSGYSVFNLIINKHEEEITNTLIIEGNHCTVGAVGILTTTNDEECDGKYTAVLPLIKQLKTVD